jgi:hypothetical protein
VGRFLAVRRFRNVALVAVFALMVTVSGCLGITAGAPTVPSKHYVGILSDGTTWIADVPTEWNGILLLYSHGYGSLIAADAPDGTATALLGRGFALAGSSYDPHGSLWALNNAVTDQFQTLAAVESGVLPHRPRQVLATGTSMGGLVSALEAQDGAGRISGALTTCGVVAGAVNAGNYLLAGDYTISRLLLPGRNVQLVGFASEADALSSANILQAAAAAAQQTAAGRARLALAMALMNVPAWSADGQQPSDPTVQEAIQYDAQFSGSHTNLEFLLTVLASIDQAVGGNATQDANMNFATVSSSYKAEVTALYKAAGLSLTRDLTTLAAGADISASPAALQALRQTSVPSGHLAVPELDLHTIADPTVPVQQEASYAVQVHTAGDSLLLRQAYVASAGHCAFSTAELVAGVLAISHRVATGTWGAVAIPTELNQVARGLRLGPARFTDYAPEGVIDGS